jgi:UDP:flavonoid glycosyltransferase YjiC (YdhE family)
VRVTGPLFFELPDGEETEIPDGDGPLVVVAPSTSQDPECRLLRVALEALAEEPVRVLATTNRHRPEVPLEVPGNAVLVPWMRYSQAFPAADAVICHGGHGTVVRALAAGAPVLVWPAVGDQGENGARVAWSGAGLSLARRFLSPRAVRVAMRRLLRDGRYRGRAEEIAIWSAENNGAVNAANLVEEAARNASSRLSPART